MRGYLDRGRDLPSPDGILINGLGPYAADFTFQPGKLAVIALIFVCLQFQTSSSSIMFRLLSYLLTIISCRPARAHV